MAAVGTLTIMGGLVTLWMGHGVHGLGVVAVGGCLVWGSLRSRP